MFNLKVDWLKSLMMILIMLYCHYNGVMIIMHHLCKSVVELHLIHGEVAILLVASCNKKPVKWRW